MSTFMMLFAWVIAFGVIRLMNFVPADITHRMFLVAIFVMAFACWLRIGEQK